MIIYYLFFQSLFMFYSFGNIFSNSLSKNLLVFSCGPNKLNLNHSFINRLTICPGFAWTVRFFLCCLELQKCLGFENFMTDFLKFQAYIFDIEYSLMAVPLSADLGSSADFDGEAWQPVLLKLSLSHLAVVLKRRKFL